jgi:hypothetical protein
MTRIFISHSSKDIDFIVDHLKPLFGRLGYTAWCSGTDLRTAADWEHQIREALATADWFIVLLSPNAVTSEWVQAETHWALENKRGRVIPVMISPCNPSDAHLRLATLQYIDFTADPLAARNRLLTVMQGRAADTAAGPATTAVPSPEPEAATTLITERRIAHVCLWIEPARGLPHECNLAIHNWAIIGRSADTDLRVDDDFVSRRHARIAVLPLTAGKRGKRLTLTDLESANGTYLNREPVVGDQPLVVNDIIEMGNSRLHIRDIT